MGADRIDRGRGRHNGVLAAALVVFVGAMVGMAYAAVPLYQIFCQVTGYGGTTRIADAAPTRISERRFTVRFDANVAAGVPWTFAAVEPSLTVRAGEVVTAMFRLTSNADRPTAATATFNVTPLTSGAYFNKIACFCFTEQTLQPGESREVPVTFFIDPAAADDEDLKAVTTITLSYTFFAPPGTAAKVPLAARRAEAVGEKL